MDQSVKGPEGVRSTFWTVHHVRPGRETSDEDWEKIDQAIIQSWSECAVKFSKLQLDLDGVREFYFDMSGPIGHLNDLRRRYIEFYKNGDLSIFDGLNRRITIGITSLHYTDNIEKSDNMTGSFIEFFVYQIFQTLNLSMPGSLGLYQSKISMSYPGVDRPHEVVVDLNGFLSENAIYVRDRHPWLKLERIDFDVVYNWISEVSPPFDMVPKCGASRALFALFHLYTGAVSPMSIIWIFHALESLLQCKSGENFNTIYSRIALIQKIEDEKYKKKLKQDLRKLYDLRSSIVHGGAQIAHPMQNEILDARAADASFAFIPQAEFGTALVLVLLQSMISRGWTSLNFSESVTSG